MLAYGTPLVDDPGRIGAVTAVGLDEVLFARKGPWRTQAWATYRRCRRRAAARRGPWRSAAGACRWFATRPPGWCEQIDWAVLDLSDPWRLTFDTVLLWAALVADPVHLIKLANQRLDEVRRRVQNEILGYRDRKDDPLYRSCRLVSKADGRPDERGRSRLLGLLDARDPRGQVRTGWHAKEVVRYIYDHHDPDIALEFVGRLGADLQERQRSPRDQQPVTHTDVVPPPEPGEPLPGSRAHRWRRGKP